jgi:uncharacterized membrane protein YphA (DoxX/SURF4 family)
VGRDELVRDKFSQRREEGVVRKVSKLMARVLTAGIFIHGGWNTFAEPGGKVRAAAKIGLPESAAWFGPTD